MEMGRFRREYSLRNRKPRGAARIELDATFFKIAICDNMLKTEAALQMSSNNF